ncbi:MAG: type II secretion system F family protein, partial [Candidatus Levyibacteriota bacterium]
VDSLSEDAKGNQRKLLVELRNDLMQGNHISFSFAKFPSVFDSVTVNLIKAAEETGTLDVTLRDLTESIKRDTEFKDKIKAALTYPAVIMVVFIGVLLLILFLVVPKLSAVFAQLGAQLPLPTRIIMWMSDVLTKNTIQVFTGLGVFILLLIFAYIRNKRMFISFLFMLPVVSTLGKQMDLARFTRSLNLLLTAGIPISSSLELAQGTVFKKDVLRAIAHSQKTVLSGKKLSDGFKDAKNIFPSIMIKITEAGEKSGSLEKSMQDISGYLDYKVENTLRLITTLVEPIMIVVVGIVVGGLMLAIITPIYSVISNVGLK